MGLHTYPPSLSLPKDSLSPLSVKKNTLYLPRESEEGPQISPIYQVGQFIWGTVGEHPVPLQAVSRRECLLISLAIKLGQWWMVCVPLPWPGMCCDTHWPAAAVVLAALLRVLPSDISYTSRWLIPLIIWTAPGMMNRWDWSVFSRTSLTISQLFLLKLRALIIALSDVCTFYPLQFKGPARFSIHMRNWDEAEENKCIIVRTGRQKKQQSLSCSQKNKEKKLFTMGIEGSAAFITEVTDLPQIPCGTN